MPERIRLRLSGDEISVGAIVNALRGMPDVDGIIEQPAAATAQRQDAGSGGNGAIETGSARDVVARLANSFSRDFVQGRIETLAHGAHVAVEWLDAA